MSAASAAAAALPTAYPPIPRDLAASAHVAVQRLIVGEEERHNAVVDPAGRYAIGRLLLSYAGVAAADVAAFAGHADRTRVTARDVRLLARRDAVLGAALEERERELTAAAAAAAAAAVAAAVGADGEMGGDEGAARGKRKRAGGQAGSGGGAGGGGVVVGGVGGGVGGGGDE